VEQECNTNDGSRFIIPNWTFQSVIDDENNYPERICTRPMYIPYQACVTTMAYAMQPSFTLSCVKSSSRSLQSLGESERVLVLCKKSVFLLPIAGPIIVVVPSLDPSGVVGSIMSALV